MTPFVYPNSPLVRRHGPSGYSGYASYRPWLRDEFAFRCIYCLKREQWAVVTGTFHIDHFQAQALLPQAGLDYNNLLYACAGCNIAKGGEEVPDPSLCMLGSEVTIGEDGKISGNTQAARKLIAKLGLDSLEYREFRMLLIGIVQLAEKRDPGTYETLLRYPDDLPDLAALNPPTNNRPQGIYESFYVRRENGELPATY